MIGIYKITNPCNKVYIGQSIDVLLRFKQYKKLMCKDQRKLYYSLKKYGIDKHTFEILQICQRDELDLLECYYIGLYQSFNTENGLNLQSGGGMVKISDESRKLMSINRKGKKLSEVHKANISKSRIGIVPWNKGKEMSINSRIKMGVTKKGDNNPAKRIEVRQKISDKAKQRIVSNSTKKKLSDKLKGRVFTNEHKEKLRKAWVRIKTKSNEEKIKDRA